jgi:hypothetical protein
MHRSEEAMRNHIRREAGQYLQPAWWLVPVVFAVAAIAAAAIGGSQEDPQPAAPVAAAVAAPAPSVPAALPVPAADAFEATEHVQAF